MNRVKRTTPNTSQPRSTAKREKAKKTATTRGTTNARTNAHAKLRTKSRVKTGAEPSEPRTVTDVRVNASGTRWSVKLSNGLRVSVPAASAHACNVRVGTRWSDALLLRMERSAARQRLVTRAMGLLAKGRCTSRVELRQALGGGRDATATVAELAKLGWIS